MKGNDWNKIFRENEDELINLFERVDYGVIDFEYPLTGQDIIECYDEIVYGDVKDDIDNEGDHDEVIKFHMDVKMYRKAQKFLNILKKDETAFFEIFKRYSKKHPDDYHYWIYDDYSRLKNKKMGQFYRYSWVLPTQVLPGKKSKKGTIDMTLLKKEYGIDKKDESIINQCISEAKSRFKSKHVDTTPIIFASDLKHGGDANPETGIVRINCKIDLFKNIKPQDPKFKPSLRHLLTHELTHIRQFERGYLGSEIEGYSDLEIMAELETLLRGGVLDIVEAQKSGEDIETYYVNMYDPDLMKKNMHVPMLETGSKLPNELAIKDWMKMTQNKSVNQYKKLSCDEIDLIIQKKKRATFLWKTYVNGEFETPDDATRQKQYDEFKKKIIKFSKVTKTQAKRLTNRGKPKKQEK